MNTILFALFFVLTVITLVAGSDPNVQFINHIVLLATIVGMGLSMGSFATALIYRLPRNIPYGKGPDGQPVRSLCPPCGRTLTALELIPVVSWIIQSGRCKCGKNEIPLTYPAIEIGTLVYTWAMFQFCGFEWAAIPRYFVVPFAVAALMIAWQYAIWPRALNQTLLVFSALVVVVQFGFAWGHFNPATIGQKLVLLLVIGTGGVLAWSRIPRLKVLYPKGRILGWFALNCAVMSLITHPVLIFLALMVCLAATIADSRKVFNRALLPVAFAVIYMIFLMVPGAF